MLRAYMPMLDTPGVVEDVICFHARAYLQRTVSYTRKQTESPERREAARKSKRRLARWAGTKTTQARAQNPNQWAAIIQASHPSPARPHTHTTPERQSQRQGDVNRTPIGRLWQIRSKHAYTRVAAALHGIGGGCWSNQWAVLQRFHMLAPSLAVTCLACGHMRVLLTAGADKGAIHWHRGS